MRELSRFGGLCALAGLFAACGATATVPPPVTPEQKATASAGADAALLADFNTRIEQYVTTHRALAEDTAGVDEESTDAAEIAAGQELLADKIRSVRANAEQGDIFTPPIADMFRRLLASELQGAEGREAKANAQDEWAAVALRVNATYPSSQPLPTVPPNILARLPQLPPDLDYRIVEGRHLVLHDVDANIIVDYIPGAIR